MGTRYYDFTSSFDQVTAPSGSSPTGASDFVNLSYGAQNYARYIDTVTNLKNVSSTYRFEGCVFYVEALDAFFQWDQASALTADDENIINPSDLDGQYLRIGLKGFGVSQNVATAATIAAMASSTPVVRLTGSTATDLQGITAGVSNALLCVYNASSAAVTLKHENGSASAANRLSLQSSVDFVVAAGGSVILRYDKTLTRWVPAHITPPPGPVAAYTAKTADYTLTDADSFVGFDVSAASKTATLPTAVGRSGKQFTIAFVVATGSFNLTINTTSSQTIGGRASGAIVLRRLGDRVTVVSDGANWQVVEKLEHEVITTVSAGVSFSTESDADYAAGDSSNSVTLTYGRWRVSGYFTVSQGTGTNIFLYGGSGFYAAQGTGTATPPTAISSTVSGPLLYSSTSGTSPVDLRTASSKAQTAPLEFVIEVTSSTTIYMVPRVGFSTAGNAISYCFIKAERLF